MKKTTLLAAMTLAMSTPTFADSYNAWVEDHYNTQVRSVPNTERICQTVEVPIYGTVQGQASTGDALAGAIIGGVIGNQVGGGSGKDAATVLGAIIGADVANKRGSSRQVITGYRQEQQCQNQTTYTRIEEEVYSHSTITWTEHGRNFTLEFQR